MLDRFDREISYLRVSVTDRCNLRCVYCANGDDFEHVPREDILSFEEIANILITASRLGVRKVRLTGGEPLVRKDVHELVALIAKIRGIDEISLTTNGTLLALHAGALAAAGLRRVNVSLDTLDRSRYAGITGADRLHDVLAGIEAARSCGLAPIKLNCVVEGSAVEPDARSVAEFARCNDCSVRFIKRMSLRSGAFSKVQGGWGGDCPACDRLRLTSDGRLVPCLMSDLSFSVKELGIDEAFRLAVANKPESGEGRGAAHAIRAIWG
jgi:cyclic pyranopterin phosphate synthase